MTDTDHAARLKSQRMNTSRLGDLLIGTFFFDPNFNEGIGSRLRVVQKDPESAPELVVENEWGEFLHPVESVRVLIDPDQRGFNKEVIKS